MARTMSWPLRSLKRAISGPIAYQRPVSFHRSAGWTTGISISWQPIASISSRITCSTRRETR